MPAHGSAAHEAAETPVTGTAASKAQAAAVKHVGSGTAGAVTTDYTKAGLPWFDYYAADLETLGGAQALALVKSMAEMAAEKGEQVLGPDGEVNPGTIISIGPGETAHAKAPPREGER